MLEKLISRVPIKFRGKEYSSIKSANLNKSTHEMLTSSLQFLTSYKQKNYFDMSTYQQSFFKESFSFKSKRRFYHSHEQNGYQNNHQHNEQQSTHASNQEKEQQNNNQRSNNQSGEKHTADDVNNTVSAWIWASGLVLFGAITGFTVASIIPPSFTEEREKEFRKKIGTDILALEDQHIVPLPRDYSHYIDRTQTIIKLDKLFDAIEHEKNYKIRYTNYSDTLLDLFHYRLRTRRIQRGVDLLLITGVQGSGKSELAEEYADKYAQKIATVLPSSVRTIKIFRAERLEDLKQQYRDFARELGIPTQDYEDEGLIIEVNKKLALRDHWLLVFDNIDNEHKQNYEKIQCFIPQGDTFKGRVILTARDRKIVPSQYYFNIKIIDITRPEYRFTTEEAVNLIDANLDKSYPDTDASPEHKIELAKNLGYLPQALKKAALCIKHSKDYNSVNAYLKFIQKQLRERLNISKIEELNVHNHYEVINNIVNALSIRNVSKDLLAISILAFAAFLNPDFIQRDLLALKFERERSDKFLDALELLQTYGLLEDKGQGYFKLHRSTVRSILIEAPKIQWGQENYCKTVGCHHYNTQKTQYEVSFLEKQLEEVIKFIKEHFKRDNTTVKARKKNSLFVPHINTLLDTYVQNQRKKLSDKSFLKLPADLLFFQVALATYYMMTGHSLKAQGELLANKVLLEKQYHFEHLLDDLYSKQNSLQVCERLINIHEKHGSQSSKKTAETEKQKVSLLTKDIQTKRAQLSAVQTELLTIYAQILYHLGCTYYDVGDEQHKDEYKGYLEKAIIIRDIIDAKIKNDKQEKQKDIAFNDFNDSQIMRRNGIMKFTYKQISSTKQLESLAQTYEAMIQEEIEQAKKENRSSDATHIQSCKSERFRIYQKLAKSAQDETSKQKYCDEAAHSMYQDKVPSAFTPVGNEERISYKAIFHWIQSDPRLQVDTRKARYLNDLGNLLLIQGKHLKLATACYLEAIHLIEEKENVNIDLPTSYLGLAKLYEQHEDIPLAQKVIKRCLLIQDKLGMHKDHEEVKEAKAVAYRLIDELEQKIVMEGVKIG